MFKTLHNLHYEQIGKEVRCIEDELPFEIPDSWEWARLNSVGSMARGNGIKRNEVVENGYPCIRYGEIYTSYNLFFKDSISHVDNNIYNSSKKIKRNDLVYTLTGENKPDIAKTVAYLGEKDIAAGGDLAVWSNHQMNPLYLSYLLSSPYMISNKVKLATGDIIVHISVDKVGSFIAPIPPLEEQNRIVKQILILEELIKEYSEKEEELYKLNSNIKKQLKKSILQYAIEGKLVPQDSNDEPASVLLERIRKEKEKLIAEGKIKKDKSESIIYRRDNSYYEKQNNIEKCIDGSLFFDIPDNWQWCRLGTIFQHNTGKALNSSNTDGVKRKYITTSNLYWNRFELDGLKEMYFKHTELDKCSIKKGDLLVCEGGDIGRAAIWNEDYSLCFQNHIHRLRPYVKVSVKYFYLIFFLYKVSGRIGGKGVGIQGLSSNSIHLLLLPIPPLATQNQIVHKYEQILTILS